jgi:hypothetical protein
MHTTAKVWRMFCHWEGGCQWKGEVIMITNSLQTDFTERFFCGLPVYATFIHMSGDLGVVVVIIIVIKLNK